MYEMQRLARARLGEADRIARDYFDRRDELEPIGREDLLERVRVIVALGAFAFDQVVRMQLESAPPNPGRKPRFAHLAEVALLNRRTLVASYHPSQQNTFTGKLTEPMFDRVWARARELAGRS